jgi:hypothetical protein
VAFGFMDFPSFLRFSNTLHREIHARIYSQIKQRQLFNEFFRIDYIIAANYERKPTKTTLQVPGVVNASAQMVFGEGATPVVAGKLTLSLNSIESRVYRISK